MTRDANEIAREYARHEEKTALEEPTVAGSRPVTGTLTIWESIQSMTSGAEWLLQSEDVHLDLSKPGLLLTYESGYGDAEIFVLQPGWYINFVPNREGE